MLYPALLAAVMSIGFGRVNMDCPDLPRDDQFDDKRPVDDHSLPHDGRQSTKLEYITSDEK
jgi:hypothetical protein